MSPLADDFAPATRSQWLALVEKTLKGAGVDTLRRRSPDGLDLAALYTVDDDTAPAHFIPASRGGDPAWDVRALVSAADPAEANDQALEDLAGGATSVLVEMDPAADARVSIGSAEALERTLRGVSLEVAPVALDAGFLGPRAAEWLAAAAKGAPRAGLVLHLDPLSAFAAAGQSPGPIEAHMAMAADTGARLAEAFPRASLFCASGRVVHEGGGGPAVELGFAAACALAYAKALDGAGMKAGEAFARIVLGLATDTDIFASVAKLRAGRIILGRIALACGADPRVVVEARSSRRMLTRADAWNNLIRLSVAGFGAVAGGADALALDSFTQPLGPPSAQSRRMARNTALVLMEEAHLGSTADPLGGAWAIEALTRRLARDAWVVFQEIEAAGGAIEALEAGLVRSRVAADVEALRAGFADHSARIVGVTDFVGDGAAPAVSTAATASAALPEVRPSGEDSRCPPLPPIRLEDLAQ